MQKPLQASESLQQTNDIGEQLSTQDDGSVTCLHGEESGPPWSGTGLSALVPNSSYTDDDVRHSITILSDIAISSTPTNISYIPLKRVATCIFLARGTSGLCVRFMHDCIERGL